MKNNVLYHQGNWQGIYQISDPINGKQSWISGSNAIWYWQGDWLIGSLEDIGTMVGSMSLFDDHGGLDNENNVWTYWTGYGWFNAGANEVSIDCTSKN